jgi:hypothetical protein
LLSDFALFDEVSLAEEKLQQENADKEYEGDNGNVDSLVH